MSKNRALSLMAVLVVGTTPAACGADEDPIGGGPFPIADLEVVVEHPDHDPISYRITCLGDTATITGDVDLDEQAACQAVNRKDVRQSLIEGVPADQICTEQYGGRTPPPSPGPSTSPGWTRSTTGPTAAGSTTGTSSWSICFHRPSGSQADGSREGPTTG
jgi:hypothetical protein